ncbi:MAG: hypothetical protein ACRYFS_15830 [Janthinobacterium lividum]
MFGRGKKLSYKAISSSNEEALRVQINADIEATAQNAAGSIVAGTFQSKMSYPPNHGFTEEELEALNLLQDIPNIESALRKVVADAASFPVFRILEYIDGVADPNDASWRGIYLVDRPNEDSDVEVADTDYHDQLYARYWDWRMIRPTKEWKLDILKDNLS